jgi:hypothetical protein
LKFERTNKEDHVVKVTDNQPVISTTKPNQKQNQVQPSRLPILKPELKHEPHPLVLPDIHKLVETISQSVSPIPHQKSLASTLSRNGIQIAKKQPHPPEQDAPSILTKRYHRKPVKIVQKYPIRKDPSSPPAQGVRSWPAGSKALPPISSMKHQLKTQPHQSVLPAIEESSNGQLDETSHLKEKDEKYRESKPSIVKSPLPPALPKTQTQQKPHQPLTERPIHQSPRTQQSKPQRNTLAPPLPIEPVIARSPSPVMDHPIPPPNELHSQLSIESIERREAMDQLQTLWAEFVESRQGLY